MTEVEIFHDAREKDVYFNGAQEWVKTQWEVRVSELPRLYPMPSKNRMQITR